MRAQPTTHTSDSPTDHSMTVMSPSKRDSNPEETEKTEMEDQTDISMSGMGSQHDTGDDKEIRVSASMKEKDHTEGTNDVNFDKNDRSEETDDKDDTERDKVATKPQADKHLSRQKKVTFPQHPDKVQDEDTAQNDGPSTISDDDDDDDEPEPEKDKEDLLILPNPVMVRPHDFCPRSVQEFLLNYPDNRENRHSMINLRFFNNEIRFQPNGTSIDNFHNFAFGKLKFLEQHHGYIQWIFPIREQGLNYRAAPLQLHEAKIIQSNPEMQSRLLKSLELMLDFYGMRMDRTNRLVITRHSDPIICSTLYRNLCESYHNYLRITRMFKSLCELGQADYVPSILLFILAEQSENGELDRRELRASMDRYWAYCMRERDAQACVAKAIKWVREEEGQFTLKVYKRIVERKQRDGVWRFDPAVDGLQKPEKRTRGIGGAFVGRLRSFRG